MSVSIFEIGEIGLSDLEKCKNYLLVDNYIMAEESSYIEVSLPRHKLSIRARALFIFNTCLDAICDCLFHDNFTLHLDYQTSIEFTKIGDKYVANAIGFSSFDPVEIFSCSNKADIMDVISNLFKNVKDCLYPLKDDIGYFVRNNPTSCLRMVLI